MLWVLLAAIGAAIAILVFNHDSGTVAGLDSDDFARLVWLGLIGLIAASALLTFRSRLGDAAKSAALWIGLAALLMAGYAHRTEIEAVALRTVSTFAPGYVVDARGTGDELQVTRSRDGHFRVRARINDATATLLVDTGATSTTLSARDAERAGIDLARLTYGTSVRTANGTTTVGTAVLDQLAVGSLVSRNVPVFVARDGQLEQSLLGLSFLGKLSSYEVRGDQMFLRR